jgi:imidazolonepropionase-like amidohydrolase
MKKIFALLGAVLLLQMSAFAQKTFPVNGVHDERPEVYAIKGATVVVSPEKSIPNATLLIKDGKIEAVGQSLNIPAEAIVVEAQGKYVYPSFIDPYTQYGMPKVGKGGYSNKPQMESTMEGAYNWNEAIKSFYQATEDFKYDEKTAEAYRKAGFGAVLAFRNDGIARGTSVFVNLAEGEEHELILKQQASAHFSFDKGSSKQDYPSSLMGAIALLRQTYLDAQWYASQTKKPHHDLALEGLNNAKNLPQIFEAADKLEILRADKVGDEFGFQYIIKGKGDEYQRADEILATNASLIIPVTYPEAYDVEDPFDAQHVTLADLKHWEMAPANASMLAQKNISFAFTTNGLENKGDFLKNVRKAVKYGLPEVKALEALTLAPARMLQLSKEVGTLEKGKVANFLIASDNIFKEDAVIYQNWVNGQQFELKPMDLVDFSGLYTLTVGKDTYKMEVSGEAAKHEAKLIINDSTNVKVKLGFEDDLVNLSFDKEDAGNIRLSGWVNGKEFKGKGELANGEWISWSAVYQEAKAEEEAKEEAKEEENNIALGNLRYPFVGFGYDQIPQQQTMLIKNATVWTNEAEGVLENTDVLVKDGKIAQLGQNLSANGAIVIDGTGKHLTTGIIDEHSHIAISRGVNEMAQAVTAEVSISDVVDSEDINIYRQLAGGVTASQLLHGSANPIGGQSALIKLRWGHAPEKMKIEGADGFIKFALGENVKQANWGEYYNVRFPQTRMGVEQVVVNAFTRAKEYEQEWKAYNALSKREKRNAVAPRKDLELETLVEIMNEERFITCHSYIQSEINMLMKVADQMGFKVNTFTHILEGYKVADKMREHGVAASTFADWWAYKFEVKDAIPYNAALMTEQGVLTAINSDDAEMGRRLNQEAAKTVKYGGMTEEQAWKMVTLNPAKMLHLDDRMGSIKAGKDADLVLWTANPLSIYAKAEKTMIDGSVYFDLKKDQELRAELQEEKARLIQKMIEAKHGGAPTRKVAPKNTHLWDCEDYSNHTRY